MRRSILYGLSIMVLVLAIAAPVRAEQARAAKAGAATGAKPETSAVAPTQLYPAYQLFDKLKPIDQVIYLVTNSSFVWGPDPHGLSEEITFTGFVNVPKWPLPGYQRRILPDGRQQIDMELSHSDLKGASYLMGGDILLGEHPENRSLGTITEAPPRHAAAHYLGNVALAKGHPSVGQQPGIGRRSFMVTRDVAQVVDGNQDVLWSDLVGGELRGMSRLPIEDIRKEFGAQTTNADPVAVELELPVDLVEKLSAAGIDVNAVVSRTLQKIAKELNLPNQDVMTLVVPADFIVARKVLLTTAKGILYNETAVPVRGKLDAIPPVHHRDDAVGLNVFRGMELPIPLLDKDKNVDGWFYSKSHLAMSVRPNAIEKENLAATVHLRSGDKVETVKLSGTAEIHHLETRVEPSGRRQTQIEFIVLALRGKSEILGDRIMMIEAFSDRDKFSRGWMSWQNDKPVSSSVDLWIEMLTPAGKLANNDPIKMNGSLGRLEIAGKVAKGDLSIPLTKSAGSEGFSSTAPVTLFNEAEKPVITVESFDLQFVNLQIAEAAAAPPSLEARRKD
jgi:uncharacterized protein DUF6004